MISSVPMGKKNRSGMGATCPRPGVSGGIRLCYYVVYHSTRYFPFSAFCVYPGGRCLGCEREGW